MSEAMLFVTFGIVIGFAIGWLAGLAIGYSGSTRRGRTYWDDLR